MLLRKGKSFQMIELKRVLMKRKVYLERLMLSDEGIFSNCRLLSSVVYILEFSSVLVNIVQL